MAWWIEEPERFLATLHPKIAERIVVGDDHWLVHRNIDTDGYAIITLRIDGRQRTKKMHRLVMEALGHDLTGLVIDHLCRVRNCVNPSHLEPVTAAENMRRKPPKTVCGYGHDLTLEGSTVLHRKPQRERPARECRECNRLTQVDIRRKRKEMAGWPGG